MICPYALIVAQETLKHDCWAVSLRCTVRSESADVIQAVATRKLLQNAATDTAAVVQVQMTGKSENQTTQIAQELGTVVSNNDLQVSNGNGCNIFSTKQSCLQV